MKKITPKSASTLVWDRRGGVAVLVALGITVLAGFTGLALDVGSYYMLQLQLQNTADAAALASVTLVKAGGEDAVRTRAKAYADLNMAAAAGHGQTLKNGDVELGIWDDTNNVFTVGGAAPNAVRVTTRRATQNGNAAESYFLTLFGMNSIDIVTVAIATKEANPGCLVTLDPSAPGSLDLDSNASIVANGCAVKVNSSSNNAIKAFSTSTITADEICVVGDKDPSGTGTTTPAVTPGCSKSFDPLKGLAAPTYPSCTETAHYYLDNSDTDPIVTLDPCVFEAGFELDGETRVFLNPGTYVIEGDGVFNQSSPDFWLKSEAELKGVGVTIYLTNGAEIYWDSDTVVELSAPTSGEMAGILIYQDRADASLSPSLVHQFDSNNVAKLEGVIYLPGSTFFSDSNTQITGAAAYTIVIANKVELDSNATMTLNSNYESVGGPPLPDFLSIAQLRR